MRRSAAAILVFAALASCPRVIPPDAMLAAPDLETAAVARGLVRDPADASVVGLYARGTDRLCIVRHGGDLRIGASIDYGEGDGCAAAGTVEQSGERLKVDLGGGCAFDALFDGDRVVFPANLPRGCAAKCTRRSSLAALDVGRLSESVSEAEAMRDMRGKLPCAGD